MLAGGHTDRRLGAGLRLLLPGLLALLAGCGEEAPEPIPPHLSAIETQIFAKNCVFGSCHGPEGPQQGLSLAAPTYAALVDVPSREVPSVARVVAGDPDASYLLQKVERATPAMGVRMPPNQPLPAYKIEAIRAWIAQGAMND